MADVTDGKCLVFFIAFCQNNNSTKQCRFTLLKKWKRALDSGVMFGALLTDHSKVFDCLDHEVVIAKRNAYRFSLPALKVDIHYNLLNSRQRNKV